MIIIIIIITLFKKKDEMNFSKKLHFLKNASRFIKVIRLCSVVYEYVWVAIKIFFRKICNIEANIDYFVFLVFCNFTFSQT